MAIREEVKFDMFRRLRVADYITLSNAFCGVLSMFCSIQQDFVTAHALIFIGYELDRFDGIVARWRNKCSDWGKELDSFCDLVTFVLAPVVMLYCAGLRSPIDQAGLAFFVLCGLTRLVRFNAIVGLIPKNAHGRALYMEGLPTAYAALIISTSIAVSAWMGWIQRAQTLGSDDFREVHWATFPVAILSTTMASKRLRLSFDGWLSIPAGTAAVFFACWWFSPA